MFLQNSGQFAAQGKKCLESDVQRSFLRGKGVSPPVRIRSRTSFRSLQQASHRERISSVGCCRSGTMTVTAPEACPARTPLKLSSSTMLPDAPEQALDEYPMPDPMLTLDDLEKCGYRDGDMLPLSKERAMELYERDLTVYAVVDGGSAEMLFDREELALLSVDRKRK